jgi:hypothetical protein
MIQLIGNINFLSHAEYMFNVRNLKILMKILEEQHEGLKMQSLCFVWYHSPHCEPEKKNTDIGFPHLIDVFQEHIYISKFFFNFILISPFIAHAHIIKIQHSYQEKSEKYLN